MIIFDGKKFYIEDGKKIGELVNRGIGTHLNNKLFLTQIEAMYLADSLSYKIVDQKGNEVKFEDVIGNTVEYLVYKDWRERGLVIREWDERKFIFPEALLIHEVSPKSLPSLEIHGWFDKTSLLTFTSEEKAKLLFDEFWFGQYGSYKRKERGRVTKYDIFETLFLIEKGILKVENEEELNRAIERLKHIEEIYFTYKELRELGFVVKPGFKFGCHFRIYVKETKPFKEKVHSKHVLHVFPEKKRLKVSEFARIIRVAHSVRKTFLLSVPKKEYTTKEFAFFAWHRKNGRTKNKEENPDFLIFPLSENGEIDGEELARIFFTGKEKGLSPLLAIVDNETAVTYYLLREVKIPSAERYYIEIDWFSP